MDYTFGQHNVKKGARVVLDYSRSEHAYEVGMPREMKEELKGKEKRYGYFTVEHTTQTRFFVKEVRRWHLSYDMIKKVLQNYDNVSIYNEKKGCDLDGTK